MSVRLPAGDDWGPTVNVTVEPNGKVLVNGELVAEMALKLAPDPGEGRYRVRPQTELYDELVLHRVALTVWDTLQVLVRHVDGLPQDGHPGLDVEDRADFGLGFVDGLARDPGEVTGRRPYRDGHRAGTTLRALFGHLDRAVAADPNSAHLDRVRAEERIVTAVHPAEETPT